MDRRERERFVEACLRQREWGALAEAGIPPGRLLRRLVHLLQSPDDLTAWRAVEALGRTAAGLGAEPLVGETLRGLFWMTNDESGNLCRKAPEAVGAILALAPRWIPPFGSLLPPLLHEEPFEAGTLWALCLLQERTGSAPEADPADLEAARLSADPRRRGLALRYLRLAGRPSCGEPVRFLDYDIDRSLFFEAAEPPL